MLQRSNRGASQTTGGGSPAATTTAPDRQPRGNAAAAERLESLKSGSESTGGAGRLPYLDKIQLAFGHHDVSGIRAVIGGGGGAAAHEMGAEAFARGETVTFQSAPDLELVAHEVAHVVQQRGGVSKAGGMGEDGDSHEQQADAVASLVVAGKSAERVLDGIGGAQGRSAGQGTVVQRKPEKKVSGGAMRRLEYARAAIKHTKEVLSFGAGNQKEALKATNFNSYFRMKAMRDPECWEMSASVRALAARHPDALTAAKCDLAAGGNCGEHAQLGFDYLRATAVGESINRCDVEGLDHAFVILGDVPREADSALSVCDPWPSAPTACLWEDHFAHTPDKSKINSRRTEKADGTDVKSVIAAGLKLSPKGEAMIKASFDEKRTDEEIEKGTSQENGAHPWIWEHPNAATTEYDYKEGASE